MARGSKGKNTDRLRDQEGTKPEGQETPFWEQVAGFIGLLLAVVGFLVYEGIQPRTEPRTDGRGRLSSQAATSRRV